MKKILIYTKKFIKFPFFFGHTTQYMTSCGVFLKKVAGQSLIVLVYIALMGVIAGCVMSPPEKQFDPAAVDEGDKPTWTIMIYMNGDNDLNSYTYNDINEMLDAFNSGISKKGINLLILWDRWGNTPTRLIQIKSGAGNAAYLSATINSQFISSNSTTELDMMDGNNLSSYVDYGKTSFPADHYALIIWGHSDGYRSEPTKGMQWDDDNSTSSFSNESISLALQNKNLDIVAFDSCLQGSFETLWSMKSQNVADYLIASPMLIPANGWNYYTFFTQFGDNSYRRVYDFAIKAVYSYSKTYSSYSGFSPTLVAYNLNAINITDTLDGSIRHFITWANTNKATEYSIFTQADHALQQDFYNLYLYVQDSNYPYKSQVKNTLDNLIFYGWIKGVEPGEYKGIGIQSVLPSGYTTNELSVDTDWDLFIQ